MRAMATLVCFHAHPDDEAIATGGTMMQASEAGHRVVLVVATRGEHGEVVPGVLDDGEQLGIRRVAETFEAARIMGVDRVEFLGYVDSGMDGDHTNDGPYSFWSADVEQAANRLAGILREEQAHGPVVLTVYDDNGGYGHPDHIQVHRVGVRAAELAGVERVFQSTMNRDHIRELMGAIEEQVEDAGGDVPDLDQSTFGKPDAEITHAIDVTAQLERKRAAMRAHASQIGPDSFFLTLPDEAFAAGFGREWFIAHGGPARTAGAPYVADLFADRA
jgi:LmbE family N-acetylglucosaminyl deacetylase